MSCSEDELLGWKDFPKGLRVLLLDEDCNSAAEMRSRLENMEYIVYSFCSESEALSAVSNKSEVFHVAIVEVSEDNSDGVLRFLESARDLPIIMTSNIHSLSMMMKCIAFGAVEFLQKPLSDDKLKNIWQHAARKVFDAGVKDVSKSVKESFFSLPKLQSVNSAADDKNPNGMELVTSVPENTNEHCDKYPAPSTPQLKQGVRSVDDGDCQDHTVFSTEQDSGEHDGDTKSVETTCNNSQTSPPRQQQEMALKGSSPHQKAEADIAKSSQSNDNSCHSAEPSKASGPHCSNGTKTNKKKMKVDWTPELHKKFVQAVEKLGIDQAIPSRILELMKVDGITRHNVASHLQKYRMHRRQIMPKEVERRWPHPPQPRDTVQRSSYYPPPPPPHTPVMSFPPPYYVPPAWVQQPSGVQVWGSPYYPPPAQWQPGQWRPHPTLHADAWGSPVMPPPLGSYPPNPPQNAGVYGMQNRYSSMPDKSFDLHPAEEVIDKVVKEAMTKPWLPLPLGLKSPSTESVLHELSRQGIPTVPPLINASHYRC